MAHHAYFAAGDRTECLRAVRHYISQHFENAEHAPTEIHELSYDVLLIEDARRITGIAYQSGTSGSKCIVVSAPRIFHEAQNALLKVIEEPPDGVYFFLVVPSGGVFLPTLRSRLQPLPINRARQDNGHVNAAAEAFLTASPAERQKIAAKLVERSKSDSDAVKRHARTDTIDLITGLMQTAHMRRAEIAKDTEREELQLFLGELARFMPLLYERSAPLKLILEHLLLVLPGTLGKRGV